MKDGVININKPSGWTSQDVCTKLRHILHIKKIGHTGTLDPMATGVLPVCTGRSTRFIEYYDQDRKSYHAGMKLGVTSDTLDIWGEVSETGFASGDVTEEAVKKAFADYTGRISQLPPKYSALKVGGRRAYDLARQGEEFELKTRDITIYSNNVSRIDLGKGEIEFDVTCSKGTYIRTICDDIGRTLGCGAVMSSLVRTSSGVFTLEDSYELTDIEKMSSDEIDQIIIPVDRTTESLGRIELYDNRVTAFLNGNTSRRGYRVAEESRFNRSAKDGSGAIPVYLVYNRGEFLGTAVIMHDELIPDKVFAAR